ncbi:hypothetical protein BLOT_014684 [Blomia tropicalis]|nr:hypothetical protein BLOT_014684 [Blomia tropicalis]
MEPNTKQKVTIKIELEIQQQQQKINIICEKTNKFTSQTLYALNKVTSGIERWNKNSMCKFIIIVVVVHMLPIGIEKQQKKKGKNLDENPKENPAILVL